MNMRTYGREKAEEKKLMMKLQEAEEAVKIEIIDEFWIDWKKSVRST